MYAASILVLGSALSVLGLQCELNNKTKLCPAERGCLPVRSIVEADRLGVNRLGVNIIIFGYNIGGIKYQVSVYDICQDVDAAEAELDYAAVQAYGRLCNTPDSGSGAFIEFEKECDEDMTLEDSSNYLLYLFTNSSSDCSSSYHFVIASTKGIIPLTTMDE